MALFAVAGDPCSGKSTTADILSRDGYTIVSMGEVLRDQLDDASEDEVWELAERLREEHGPHGVATVCVDDLIAADGIGSVLEGCRSPAEVNYIASELDRRVHVIWVEADIEDRVRWFSGREGRGSGGENTDPRDALAERTRREREAGMDAFESRYDYYIKNDGDLDDLAEKVRRVVASVESTQFVEL